MMETWIMVRLGTRRVITERARIGHPHLKLRAPSFYPTERPTRLRSSRGVRGKALPSPAMSIVRSGHVAMPELATGNGAGTARCIRPGGRRDGNPNGQNSRWVKQVWEPEG